MSTALRGRFRASAVRVAAVSAVVAALALAGCSSSKDDQGSPKPNDGGGSGSSASASGGGGSSSSPSGPDVKISVTPGSTDHANPITPIVVKASQGTLQSVSVTNAKEHGLLVSGRYATGKTSWSSTQVLGYGKTYQVSVAAVDGHGQVAHQRSTVTTIHPTTAYPSVVPPPSSTDIGVGMPIAVRFDKPIKDRAAVQKLLSVTSSPAQPGAWYWLSDTEVDYRGAHYWKANSKLSLKIRIYGKDLGGGVYGDTDRTINYSVHDSWIAYADGSTEQMSIQQNGQTVKTMDISMGAQKTPTHLGSHVISAKDREYTMDSCTYGVCQGDPNYYRSKEYYAERISDDGEFVHENPNSVSAQGSTNVSHGCINLNEANAAWFFDHMGVGDVVEVRNSGGSQLPLGDRIGVWALSWPTWQAGNATS